MATIIQLSSYAQTAVAAYADNLTSTEDNGARYVEAGMSASQAAQFDTTWNVLSQSAPSGDGFSAVLLQNRVTGEKVLAIAGTDPSTAADLLTDLFNIGALGSIVAMPQYISLLNSYSQLVSSGELTSTEQFTVTGHSLGGFLAQAFAVIHSNVVSSAYTYNAPGFTGGAGQLLDFLGVIPGSLPGVTITNVHASDGISVTAGLGVLVGTSQEVRIEQSAQPINNHSIGRLADSLAVQALLNTLDVNLSPSTGNALVQAASNQTNRSLESLLDALLHMLVGDITTGTDDREAPYTNIKGLTDQLSPTGSLASLAGNLHLSPASTVLASEARTEFSALMALQTLSTVVLRGSNQANQLLLDATLGGVHADTYALWQADHSFSGRSTHYSTVKGCRACAA